MQNQLTQNTFNNTLDNETQYINYALNNALLNLNTIFPARVTAINGLYATIQPTINVTATNQASPLPASLTNVPIGYIIGGSSGIEIELQIGDIVLCGAIMRDVSNIKSNWAKQSNPGSARKFSISDAIILMGLRNTLPTNKIKITDEGIEITATGLPISINGTPIEINSDDVRLGNSATSKALGENMTITATITGVMAGSDTVTTTFIANAGGSSKVKVSI
jgi:hypothetical protein